MADVVSGGVCFPFVSPGVMMMEEGETHMEYDSMGAPAGS